MTVKAKNGNGNGNAAESAKEVKNAEVHALTSKIEAFKNVAESLKRENADLKAEADRLKADAAKPKVHPALSLEKRIQKVDELNIIIEKWRKLNEARQNVNNFKIGNDGLSVTLTLQDAAGKTFKTSHNVVVSSVLQTLQNELDDKIVEVEKQINFLD